MQQNRFPIASEYGGYRTLLDADGEPVILGAGKFGITLQAFRERQVGGGSLRDEVAVKVIRESVVEELGNSAAIIEEILALRALQHPNLIRYIDCGEENGKIFLVMELCKGGDLSAVCSRFGPLRESSALRLVHQVCGGMEEAHRKGFIHRDLKPSNILLVESVPVGASSEWLEEAIEKSSATFKVVDFGLAGRADGDGDGPKHPGFIGTPHYCSPEQAREQALDIRTDIYSLGITLWYLIVGRFPLDGSDVKGTMRGLAALKRHTLPEAHDADFPAGITDELRQLLSKMLAKNRDERFDSMQQVARKIQEILEKPGRGVEDSHTRIDQGPPIVTKPGAWPASEWGVGNEDDYYEILSGLGARSVGKWFKGRLRASGEPVGLTLWSASQALESDHEKSLRNHLKRLQEAVCDEEAPQALTRLVEIRRTASTWCVAEEWHSGVLLSHYLSHRNRPLALDEARRILHPIAEGSDYLYTRGFRFAPLNVEEVKLLGGEGIETISARSLGDWSDWGVRFSALGLPEELYEMPDESEDFHGETISGISVWDTGAIDLLKSFCRLVYRLMEGAEVAIAADWDKSAYVESSRLSSSSNRLLRDFISGETTPDSAAWILKRLHAR